MNKIRKNEEIDFLTLTNDSITRFSRKNSSSNENF
jgi:hypothetical protein